MSHKNAVDDPSPGPEGKDEWRSALGLCCLLAAGVSSPPANGAAIIILTDYSFVEMLPGEDELFEPVSARFNDLSIPLIRYRCGDLVRRSRVCERCACGRAFPLIEQVMGRVDDPVKLPDGLSIGRLDHIFKDVEGILEAQICQDRLDAVTILVVPDMTFSERVLEILRNNARHRFGDEIALDVRLVDAIPQTKIGKFKLVVCNV